MLSKRSSGDGEGPPADARTVAEAKATPHPATKSRIESEGAKRLARLGGSDPELKARPRRRSNPA